VIAAAGSLLSNCEGFVGAYGKFVVKREIRNTIGNTCLGAGHRMRTQLQSLIYDHKD
jgi:hypothetical protein